MKKEQTFIEFIKDICERPEMYCGKSFEAFSSFINGYRYAKKTLRKFDNAFSKGDKKLVESLIIEKEKAEELINGGYPDSYFIERLNASNLYNKSIEKINESEDGKTIEFLISGWTFPVEIIFEKSKWKINANRIIESRNSKTIK